MDFIKYKQLLIYIADFLHDGLRHVPEHHEREAEKESQCATKLGDERVDRIVVDLLHHFLHARREADTEYHFIWVFLVSVEYKRFLYFQYRNNIIQRFCDKILNQPGIVRIS